MTNEEYIGQHCRDDVRALALGRVEPGVDMRWCLQQIEGWQRAVEKLPRWAAQTGIWYPPALSMEQCSGEWAAEYKRSVVERLLSCAGDRRTFVDLTGGYGIDFSYLAPLFAKAVYVERNPELCCIAEHNFSVMGIDDSAVICADSIEYLNTLTGACSLVFLDPARRDSIGRKTVAIEDCTPNIVGMQTRLLGLCRYAVIKLSPMLDITAALSSLR
ncbi:MAG: SAM-dependent methyltransferase, partial [Bacteroidaceae bacterium]|nr:SAM-dependent methyltransferase [Bacteroidaceae bacterium]